jgi:Putative MetA-pathway of phenol degradation
VHLLEVFKGLCLLLLGSALVLHACAQEPSLEQRLPLELVYADSIVPQDLHEAMLTTGGWYLKRDAMHDAMLTQKVEWGISDSLQISTLVQAVRSANLAGPTATGMGDFEIGARYTWATVGSRFTHVAIAFDAGFPTGSPGKGLGEGAYTVSPSLLLSHEFREGKFQAFTTTGLEFVVDRRQTVGSSEELPHHSIFSNSGLSLRAGRGWAVGELSVTSNRWSGGNETQVALAPSYVWRIARRTELLLSVPIGLTSSSNRIGGVVKFTFELGGRSD